MKKSRISRLCSEHYEAGEIVAGWLLATENHDQYYEQRIRRFKPGEEKTYLLPSVSSFAALAKSIAKQTPRIDVPEKIARNLRKAIKRRQLVQDHHLQRPNKTPKDIERDQKHEYAIKVLKDARDYLGISPY